VAIEVTPRAIDVLRRALEAGRLDPTEVGIRVSVAKGLKGDELRTGFAEQAEPGEEIVEAGGIRLYLSPQLAAGGATIDVADEHDRIVLR
jgi:Fe-S cluster assembly iron-binding protein IscA